VSDLTPAGELSPDGKHYWNGTTWVAAMSPDGQWRWDGRQWVAATAAALGTDPTMPIVVQRPSGLAFQFGGPATWSIGLGLVSVLVPILTPIYFPILPLFGIWRGVTAIRSGRLAGGIVGLAINGVGVFVSLVASGLILR
jgi:hypothetical protein